MSASSNHSISNKQLKGFRYFQKKIELIKETSHGKIKSIRNYNVFNV